MGIIIRVKGPEDGANQRAASHGEAERSGQHDNQDERPQKSSSYIRRAFFAAERFRRQRS